ncbi:MAG: zinc ribbon domain-containing protein [Clostridia bacterium]
MEKDKNEYKTRDDFITDSEYYTNIITHPEEFESKEPEEEQEQEIKYYIFECLKCGFVFDEIEQKKKITTISKCPNCGAKIDNKNFKIITKKRKEEIKYKKKKEEKRKLIEEKRQEEIENAKEVTKYVKEETIAMFKNLRNDLLNGKITKERFVTLAMNISFMIAKTRKKEYLPDWGDYRREMLRNVSKYTRYF